MVSECLGLLFAQFTLELVSDVEAVLRDNENKLKTATVARSFLFSGTKINDENFDYFVDCVEPLVELVANSDIDISRFAMESINTIIKSRPALIKNLLKDIVVKTQGQFTIRKDLIKKIQLPDGQTQE